MLATFLIKGVISMLVLAIIPMKAFVSAQSTVSVGTGITTFSTIDWEHTTLTSLGPAQTFITLPVPIPDWFSTIKFPTPVSSFTSSFPTLTVSSGNFTGNATKVSTPCSTAMSSTTKTATYVPGETLRPRDGSVGKTRSPCTNGAATITSSTTKTATYLPGEDIGPRSPPPTPRSVGPYVVFSPETSSDTWTTITLRSSTAPRNSSDYTPTANVQYAENNLLAADFVEPTESIRPFTTFILPASGTDGAPLTVTSFTVVTETPSIRATTTTMSVTGYNVSGTAIYPTDFTSDASSKQFNLGQAALEPLLVVLMISTVAMAVRLWIFLEG